MFADGHVTAVVDWELAHLGDPMDDIAWLSLRATQEPFPDFPARVARVRGAVRQRTSTPARVRYYRVMAETKLQVMSHRGLRARAGGRCRRREPRRGGAAGGGDVGNSFIYGLLHRRLWLEALAAAAGLELEEVEARRREHRRDHDWMYDAVLAPTP